MARPLCKYEQALLRVKQWDQFFEILIFRFQ